MSAQPRHLSVLSYAQGFTLWSYKETFDLNNVFAADFWTPVRDMFAYGDRIIVSAPNGTADFWIGKDRLHLITHFIR